MIVFALVFLLSGKYNEPRIMSYHPSEIACVDAKQLIVKEYREIRLLGSTAKHTGAGMRCIKMEVAAPYNDAKR